MSTSTSPRLEGLRVLVVDDDDDARELLGLVLERQGATVFLASGGRQAIALQATVDVLVSDISMSDMDGRELLRRLRASGATFRAVALTGHPRGRAEGFDAHVMKPAGTHELVDAVAGLAARACAATGS